MTYQHLTHSRKWGTLDSSTEDDYMDEQSEDGWELVSCQFVQTTQTGHGDMWHLFRYVWRKPLEG